MSPSFLRIARVIGILMILIGITVYVSFNNALFQKADMRLPASQVSVTSASTAPDAVLFPYIEVMDSCDAAFSNGTCVAMRSGAGTNFRTILQLRTGVVLKVKDIVTVDGVQWYRIDPGNDIRYQERITEDWYLAAGDYIRFFYDEGEKKVTKGIVATSTKSIVIDVSQQILYAYDGEDLFMKEPISAGLEITPTPHGTFSVFKKTPSRYMQGPLPGVSEQVYDLPGVPWDLYFTTGGAVIHGAYWHDHFGEPWSHGCVNMSPENAKKLYLWADIGTSVLVQK